MAFFLLNHPFQNAYPMNYGAEYVFFMCARVCACVRASQVTPILNGFVPEVIFTTPTGKMIREKFGRTYTYKNVYRYINIICVCVPCENILLLYMYRCLRVEAVGGHGKKKTHNPWLDVYNANLKKKPFDKISARAYTALYTV